MGPKHFGERHAKFGQSWDRTCPLYKEWGANGECWQKTGLHGFLSERLARKAIARVLEHAPKNEYQDRWRLVRREVTVIETVLVEGPSP